MANYTEHIKFDLYNTWDKYDTSEDDYEEMIEYLNSSDFRSFGEGLTYLISSRAKNGEIPLDCLRRCFEEKGISIKELGSINTPKNWINKGDRPPKGDESRRKMFVLAFALGLNSDETAYLFQKIFLDRAYNPRNYKELIYAYCIENGLSFAKAEEMIASIKIDGTVGADKTVYTKMIAGVIADSKTDSDVVEYINSHPHNFSVNSISAKKKIEEYIVKATKTVWNEMVIKYKFISGEFFQVEETKQISYDDYILMNLDQSKFIIPEHYVEYVKEEKEGKVSKRRDLTSINFIYEFITELILDKGKGTGASPFKNAYLPKEISMSFPTPQIFSKLKQKEPTYDELRKMLILLFSYCFWQEGKIPDKEERIEYYVARLNNELVDANLPELYPGNPFDWLFYFCTMSENPLDTFRAILFEVIEDTED